MVVVKIVDIISSPSAVSPKSALKVYDFVIPKIQQNLPLEIDFEGVEDLTSAFSNALIGKLYMNFDPQLLDSIITYSNIDKSGIWFKKITNSILLGTNENARALHKANIEELIFS